MHGHVRRRGPSWQVLVYAGRNPTTGARRYLTRSVRGTRDDAERVRRQLVAAAETGAVQGYNATFGQLCDAWLASATARLAPNTAAETTRIVERWLRPDLGDIPLHRLRAEHLDNHYRRLLTGDTATGKPLSAGTVARIHGVARRALNVARRWGWIAVNPADLATPPRTLARVITPPSPADVRRLLDTAARAERTDLHTFIVVAATTGARRGELCGLRWTDIDASAAQLSIVRAVIIVNGATHEAPTKTRRTRRVALDPTTNAALNDHRDACERRAHAACTTIDTDGFVFSTDPRRRTPWRPDEATRTFRRVARHAGLQGVRLHDLRHYVATQLLTAGIDVRTVAGRLGHGRPSTTLNTYAAFLPQADRRAADIVGGLLGPAAP